MTDHPADGTREPLAHVLLPANREDAAATAAALEPYGPEHVTALHVVAAVSSLLATGNSTCASSSRVPSQGGRSYQQ